MHVPMHDIVQHSTHVRLVGHAMRGLIGTFLLGRYVQTQA